jgi:DNA-directed RNA polymerase subunit alpha
MAPNIDVEDFLQLQHLARQCRAERKDLENLLSSLSSASLSETPLREAAIRWALDEDPGAGINGNTPLALMIQARIKDTAGDRKGALSCATKAAKAAPTDAACVLGQVDAMRKDGQDEEALTMLESLRREFSDRAEFHYQEGCCLENLGRHDEAMAALEKAIEVNGNHHKAIFQLASLCDLRGDDETALELYKKIGPGRNNSFISASLNMALLYEDRGDYQKAKSCCEAVLKVDPNNHRARLFLVDISESAEMYYSPEDAKESERLESILRIPVSDFELSVRSRNCLARMDIRNLGDLVRKSEQEMLAYKNFGETSLREIREMLASRNIRLGMLAENGGARTPAVAADGGGDDTPIDDLELSVRSRKCMDRLGITTIGQLTSMSEAELMGAKNFGRVSMQEIKAKLVERGINLKQD